MDIQKAASITTATAVLGTGAFVGGNHQIDKMQGGPQKREDAKIEAIRQVVREEIIRCRPPFLQARCRVPPHG